MKVRIAGVPEHFNMPWHLAMGSGAFAEQGMEILWTDYPTGTGAMMQALKNNETDIAITLTEGTLAAISGGIPCKIVGFFTESPLRWGIHLRPGYQAPKGRFAADARVAISRYGSGSHLMARLLWQQYGYDDNAIHWVVVNDIQGAEKAFVSGMADVFLWERYTTQHLVDKGVMDFGGIFETPWPCFVVVAHQDFMLHHPQKLAQLMEIIYRYNQEIMTDVGAAQMIANKYHLKQEAVGEWMQHTRWSTSTTEAMKHLHAAVAILQSKQILPPSFSADTAFYQLPVA